MYLYLTSSISCGVNQYLDLWNINKFKYMCVLLTGYTRLCYVRLCYLGLQMYNMCPSILLYSKLAIRKEEGKINRKRRKRNFISGNSSPSDVGGGTDGSP
jgi:hypothetical protein